MFLADRLSLLEFVDALGATRCEYGTWPDGPCDCKYGWRSREPHGSEQTGCPELRSLRTVMTSLTDEEWERVVAREGHVLTGTAGGQHVRAAYLAAMNNALETADAAMGRLKDNLAAALREPVGGD